MSHGENPTPVDGAQFRELVSAFASGVTVVTTVAGDGRPWGFTATSFSSVSLDPPLILVSLDLKADSHPAFDEARCFAVNILAHGQEELAKVFATKNTNKFERVPVEVTGRLPAPLLSFAHAHLECEVFARHRAGDHTIIIGKVVSGQRFDRAPLLYYQRAFGRFTP